MDLDAELRELQAALPRVIERERLVRDAAFLDIDEDIAGYPAKPLTLYQCNLLRMMGSPFLPPFETPGPEQLAGFLWVVSPEFIPGQTPAAVKARNRFMKTCRRFVRPQTPLIGTTRAMEKWEQRAGEALAIFTQTVAAARAYVTEALQDRAEATNAGPQPEYYSDFCFIATRLMRHYHGVDYREIQFMPLKVIYQMLKEIREHESWEAGKTPLMWNGSDEVYDRMLELMNRNN